MIGTGAGFGCRGELETPKETNSKSNVLTKESATVDKASVDENVSATSAIDLKNCRALLIGVDEYEKLPSLEYASYDVKKIRGALLEIGFPEECVRMFVSDGKIRERPSRKRILEAFDKMLSETNGDSTVFVVLSGHGFETKNGDAAFCPEDVDIKTTEDGTPIVISSTAILLDDVVKRLQNDDARFKMLIVDACREPVSTARKINERARSFAPVDASGLAFLQSCGSRELSWEHPDVGGVFTHFFVEGLRGGAARENGGVTFLDARGYASKETQRFVAERRAVEQTPFLPFPASSISI